MKIPHVDELFSPGSGGAVAELPGEKPVMCFTIGNTIKLCNRNNGTRYEKSVRDSA
ncbi:MAG: hypothetical protein PVG61_05535 [Dehalococcoidia bacterium]